jgi:hypothetical protein
MATQCSRCLERYPSPYYMVAGSSPVVCNKCAAGLDLDERDALLEKSARAVGQAVRRCLRCKTAMMRGELAYQDRSPGETRRVRNVSWVLARRESFFLGLLTDWVVDKALAIDAWRCSSCGQVELATDADPKPGEEYLVRAKTVDDDTALL